MALWLMLLYPLQGCSQNFKIEEALTTKVSSQIFEKGKIWARKASPKMLTSRNIVWIWAIKVGTVNRNGRGYC